MPSERGLGPEQWRMVFTVELLLKTLVGLDDVEAVWNVIGGLVPPRHIEQARHNLLRFWEVYRESS